jgi:uncharacterized UBP type Zn finger protein
LSSSSSSAPLPSVTYKLHAIVHHSGASMKCGHYFTTVCYASPQNPEHVDWLEFNDSSVIRVCGSFAHSHAFS